jgi:hypothetical protein
MHDQFGETPAQLVDSLAIVPVQHVLDTLAITITVASSSCDGCLTIHFRSNIVYSTRSPFNQTCVGAVRPTTPFYLTSGIPFLQIIPLRLWHVRGVTLYETVFCAGQLTIRR